ncbi:MAG: aspartate aminotransferase family protein [Cellvibrionales bacterium]
MENPSVKSLVARRSKVLSQHSPLFYDQPLHLVKGEGVWLFDYQGRRYLDVYNNVPHVGHCNPRVVEAMRQQASTLNIHTRYLHQNIVDYVERLTATFDLSLSMAMLTCTGSEANELALRMARHYSGAMGVIVTDCAYHGNTEAVAELGTAFMPDSKTTKRVKAFASPDSYRGLANVKEKDLADAYGSQVQQAIDEFHDEGIGVAAILVCPAFANEGLLDLPKGFLENAVAKVRRAGGLFIADEVQVGFGRTGRHMWAHQQYGVTPDIVTLGKPMGNGYPLAGVVARGELIEQFSQHAMYFNTFGGTPVACAIGMAVLDVLEHDNLLENAIKTGGYVKDQLVALQRRHAIIGDVRDQGLFFAVELVKDRQNKDPAINEANRVINLMRNHGVLISTIGKYQSILKVRPPMPFYQEHAELFISTLDKVLQIVDSETPL